jgi:hypothetical protein
MEELLHLLIISKNIKEFVGIHFFILFKGFKHDILGCLGLVGDWTLKAVVIVGTHGAKHSSSTDVHVQLILKINE